jgi:hypothetical protein
VLTVKTIQDVERMRGERALNPRYLEYVEELFGQLREALGDGDDGEFDLGPHGYVVVLEAGDDVRHLPAVGLRQGLLRCWPEFVEAVDLGDVAVYRVGVLLDNEVMMIFLSAAGQFDPEVEAWLQGEAGVGPDED